jgi:serine protease
MRPTAIVWFLLALLAAGIAAQLSDEKLPGHLFRDLDATGNFIVKFREEASVRVHPSGVVSEAGRDLGAFRATLAAFPGATIARLFERSEAELRAERREAEARTGRRMPDLNGYIRITFDGPVDWPRLVDALNALPVVAVAYPEARAQEPSMPALPVWPATPDFTAGQTYRQAPPDGINAPHGNRFPGGLGQGVQLVDFERGWNHTHEDLGSPPHLYGTIRSGSRDHGTAVLGELLGFPNGFGVTGIAPSVSAATVSYYNDTVANALNRAVGSSKAGDVILLEAQLPELSTVIPIEWEQATFDVVKIATGKGIHVFAAAGNGSQNLDDAKFLGRFDRRTRDSGAVLCAASNGRLLDPASFTNYGSRIDAHGWGYNVTSAGYGDLYRGSGENQYYTAVFSGTSSASPIVTGAGLVIEGVSRALRGKGLAPLELRDLITATGTPQNPSTWRIGPRPDLKRALSRVGGHLSSDGQAWPGRIVPLDLVDIDSPGKTYWAAASFANAPGIVLADKRVIPLDPDPLFFLSLSGLTTLFADFQGTLDAAGYAVARLEILNAPFTIGLTIHTAFVVLEPASPTGVGTISNPWPVKVTAKP